MEQSKFVAAFILLLLSVAAYAQPSPAANGCALLEKPVRDSIYAAAIESRMIGRCLSTMPGKEYATLLRHNCHSAPQALIRTLPPNHSLRHCARSLYSAYPQHVPPGGRRALKR